MRDRQVTRTPRPAYGRPPTKIQSKRRLDLSRYKRLFRPLLAVVAILGLWSLFSIRGIEVTGFRQLESSSIRKLAEQALQRHFWSRNLLSMDTQVVSAEMILAEPRLKSVRLARRWPNRLQIGVTEKQPALWWQTGQQKYLLDSDGSIIGPASGSAPLTIVVDSTNLPVKVGDKVAPPGFVRFCSDLVTAIPRTGLAVTELRVPDTTSEVYASTSKGYVIKFDSTRGVGEQIDDLNSVLQTLTKLKKTPSEYIDLRIEHKAYYR